MMRISKNIHSDSSPPSLSDSKRSESSTNRFKYITKLFGINYLVNKLFKLINFFVRSEKENSGNRREVNNLKGTELSSRCNFTSLQGKSSLKIDHSKIDKKIEQADEICRKTEAALNYTRRQKINGTIAEIKRYIGLIQYKLEELKKDESTFSTDLKALSEECQEFMKFCKEEQELLFLKDEYKPISSEELQEHIVEIFGKLNDFYQSLVKFAKQLKGDDNTIKKDLVNIFRNFGKKMMKEKAILASNTSDVYLQSLYLKVEKGKKDLFELNKIPREGE